jgi:two-component system response regulator
MRRKILLVEDNLDDEALTRRALGKSGFDHELVVVRDGKEALDYLFREGPYAGLSEKNRPDLIFLDLKLPLLGGLEVLERLRDNQETRVIPVVVLTSSKQEDDVLRSYNLGANSYIRKRVDALAFQEALKDTLSYWFDFIKLPTRG